MAKETDILLKVGLDTKDVASRSKELQQEIKRIFEASSGKQLTSQLASVQTRMAKASTEADKLKTRLKELENTKVPTAEYAEVKKQIDDTSVAFDKLLDKQEELQRKGKASGPVWNDLQYKMEEASNTIEYAKGELQDLVDRGKAFKLGSDTEEYKTVQTRLQGVNNQMTTLVAQAYKAEPTLKKSFKGLSKTVGTTRKEVSKLGDTLKKNLVAKPVEKLSSGFKSMFRAIIGAGSVYAIFRKIINAAKEGVTNLAKWNNGNNEVNRSISALMSSLTTFKNSIGAAFAPILTVVAPILTKFVDMLTAAANKVAEFFALITGKKTVVKAVKVNQDYAGSFNDVAESVEKANDALGHYDELNVIGQEKAKSSGGGGGGGISPNDMFEEVPVDMELPPWMDNLIDKVKELGEEFKRGFLDALGDVGPRLKIIEDGLETIKEAAISIFSDPRVQQGAWKALMGLMYMLGSFAGMVASIGLTIGANLIGGIAKYLKDMGGTETIRNYLIRAFDIVADIEYTFGKLFGTIAYIFESWASEGGIKITASIIGIFTEAITTVSLLFMKLGQDILHLIVDPIVENAEGIKTAFENIFNFFGTMLEPIVGFFQAVGDALISFYDNIIHPTFEKIKWVVSLLIEVILDLWNNYIYPVMQNIANKFAELFNEHINPFVEKLKPLFEAVGGMISALWEKIKPFVEFIVHALVDIIGPVIQAVFEVIASVFSAIFDIIGTAFDILGGFVDFVVAIFTGDIEGAFDALGDIVCGALNLIISAVEGLVNIFISALNVILGGISAVASAFSGTDVDLKIPKLEIPRLASGAVIPPNNEFLAVLGDQKKGTNIEAPLDTITDAFRQVMMEFVAEQTRQQAAMAGDGNASTNMAPIVLQLEGRQVAEVVWDESDKKYKQTGKRPY